MADLGRYQSPWTRLQRLMNAQQEGLRALTDVTAQAVDLEARRRVSEQASRRLGMSEKQFERRAERETPRDRPSGLMGTIEDVFRQTGRIAAGPEYEEAFLPSPQGLAPPLPSSLGMGLFAARDPESFQQFAEPFGRWAEAAEDPERLRRLQEQRAALYPDQPPLTKEDLYRRGYQAGVAAVQAPTPGPLEFTAGMAEVPFKLPFALMEESHEKIGEPVAEALLPGEHPWIEKPLSYVTDPVNIALFGPAALRLARAGVKGTQALRAGGGIGAAKPMTQADIVGPAADIAGPVAPDIAAGARGTPGEIWTLVERAGMGTVPRTLAADPGVAGGAITRLTHILSQTKPLRAEVEEFKSGVMRKKVGALRGVQAGRGGEAGFKAGMGTLRGTTLPAKGEPLAVDTMVWAKDRNNIGRILSVSDDGTRAEVHFFNRNTKLAATKTMDTSLLTPVGGEVRWQFTQAEIDAMVNAALDHPAAAARPLDASNAQAALLDMLGGKLPTVGEIGLLEKFYGTELAKAAWSNRTMGQKAWQSFTDVINLPRTVMASIDNSFPLRQGVMTMPRHPKEWFGNLPESFRSGFSANRARIMNEALLNDATVVQTNYGPRTVSELAEEGGLFRATIEGVKMTEREEYFLSNLAKRIPILGIGVRWSERAFVTYGNKLRHDIFKNTLLSWQSHSENIDPKAVKALANLINRMTGRGTLGPLNEIAPLLSAGFFAPRFAISRPQAFLQLFNWQNPKVARMAASEIVGFVAEGTSILSLVELSGLGDVELDPRSADWGKIRIGDTRIDFWGGNIQWARLVAQLQQGKRKTSDGIVVDSDAIHNATRFLRYKLSPPGSATADWMLGETAIGEEFPPTGMEDITKQVLQRTAPMAVQDLVEAIIKEGTMGFLFGVPAFGGVGVQTYETKQEAFERKTGQKWSETPGFRRRELIAADPELQRFEDEEPTTGEQIRGQRSATLLPLAQDVLRGTPGAARNYHNNRSSIMTRFAGVSENEFANLDIPIVGDDMEILEKYYAIDFLEDRNEDGLHGDDEDVRLALEEQDGLLKQLSSGVQKSMENPANFFPDEDVQKVERDRAGAQEKVEHLFENIPKYSGDSVEWLNKVEEYIRYVRFTQKDALREHGDNWGWSLPELAAELGKEEGMERLGNDAALILSDDALWNEKYNDYLIDNQEIIAPWYPTLYQRVIFRESGVLKDKVWQEVNLAVQPPAGQGPSQEALAAFKG